MSWGVGGGELELQLPASQPPAPGPHEEALQALEGLWAAAREAAQGRPAVPWHELPEGAREAGLGSVAVVLGLPSAQAAEGFSLAELERRLAGKLGLPKAPEGLWEAAERAGEAAHTASKLGHVDDVSGCARWVGSAVVMEDARVVWRMQGLKQQRMSDEDNFRLETGLWVAYLEAGLDTWTLTGGEGAKETAEGGEPLLTEEEEREYLFCGHPEGDERERQRNAYREHLKHRPNRAFVCAGDGGPALEAEAPQKPAAAAAAEASVEPVEDVPPTQPPGGRGQPSLSPAREERSTPAGPGPRPGPGQGEDTFIGPTPTPGAVTVPETQETAAVRTSAEVRSAPLGDSHPSPEGTGPVVVRETPQHGDMEAGTLEGETLEPGALEPVAAPRGPGARLPRRIQETQGPEEPSSAARAPGMRPPPPSADCAAATNDPYAYPSQSQGLGVHGSTDGLQRRRGEAAQLIVRKKRRISVAGAPATPAPTAPTAPTTPAAAGAAPSRELRPQRRRMKPSRLSAPAETECSARGRSRAGIGRSGTGKAEAPRETGRRGAPAAGPVVQWVGRGGLAPPAPQAGPRRVYFEAFVRGNQRFGVGDFVQLRSAPGSGEPIVGRLGALWQEGRQAFARCRRLYHAEALLGTGRASEVLYSEVDLARVALEDVWARCKVHLVARWPGPRVLSRLLSQKPERGSSPTAAYVCCRLWDECGRRARELAEAELCALAPAQ